ncbi:MAG: hypothetical protein LBP62_07830 [Clostridiales bacterium]|nr:hypothetical protein [Clostridiales bacterium]
MGYGDSERIAVSEDEQRALQYLIGDKRCIETSVGFAEGDKIVVTAGALTGKESIIKRINKHKRQAVIEIEFFGAISEMTVGLEIIHAIAKDLK